MTEVARITGMNHHSFQGISNDLPARVLKYGTSVHATTRANTNDSRLMTTDSVKNWLTMFILSDPTTFLSPTSFALLADLAVERLMKLIHAITSIKQATAPNSHTKRISPCEIVS